MEDDEPPSDEDNEPSRPRAQINLQAITQAMLDKASENPDLDRALDPLMDAAGIKDGDVAGVVFSGPKGQSWPTAAGADRLEMLGEWMSTEYWMAN
ncbi:hypothetical protein RBA41_28500 [Massilia sp. CCM 9210]|uniref:hypothetical protein n=1 Tax=Massilia scottii TaxID=3057166 RepID=UPI0027968454|nr:hypothetical protein [Massilia sp. CCM 9210]MDQ1817252.1 hypothetical protein [Massilia sp. CCM 9210]